MTVRSGAEDEPAEGAPVEGDGPAPLDWTTLPVQLDRQLEALDEEGALRSTVISVGDTWSKRSQKNLLVAPQTSNIGEAA